MSRRFGPYIVLATYLIVVLELLFATDFLPYVFDNNESFSAFQHGSNLYHFGFHNSFGLTDEVASPDPAAHPIIHTHQGNWPRIFTWLLYAIGFRTVESQITVAALTIGAGGLWLAYRFFARTTTAAFAICVGLVLATDYILVVQWQVNSYRVWHLAFVFACLLLAEDVGSGDDSCASNMGYRWFTKTLVVYAALFYYELVFAVFLAVFAALYAMTRSWRHPRRLILAWGTQAIGGALGIGTLLFQLVLFMGWNNVVRDFQLTLTARSFASDKAALTEVLRTFYEPLNILFLYNLADGSHYQSLFLFVRSFFAYGFQVQTPILTLVSIVVGAGGLLALVSGADRFASLPASSRPVSTRYLTAIFAVLGFASLSVLWLGTLNVVARPLGLGVVLIAAIMTAILVRIGMRGKILPRCGAALGTATLLIPNFLFLLAIGYAGQVGGLMNEGEAAPGLIWVAIDLLGAAALAWAMVVAARGLLGRAVEISLRRLLAVAFLVLGAAAFVDGLWTLYDQPLAPIWFGNVSGIHSLPLMRLASLLAIFLAAVVILTGGEALFGSERGRLRKTIIAYFGSGLVAYAFVYTLSPGYVYSGYLGRFAPFLVYFVDVSIAGTLYILMCLARRAWFVASVERPFQHWSARSLRENYLSFCAPVIVGLTFLLVGLGSAYWINIQYSYLRLFPANELAFLSKLSEPPLHGRTSIASNYSLPFAVATGAWSYLDPGILTGKLSLGPNGYEMGHSNIYVWFADRVTNASYRRPDMFICYVSQTFQTALAQLPESAARNSWCSTLGIVRQAMTGNVWPLHHRILARDESGRDRWAIVDLDWDFPPYLKPAQGASQARPVAASMMQSGVNRSLDVRYVYAQQDGMPEAQSDVELYKLVRWDNGCRIAATPTITWRVSGGAATLPLPQELDGAYVIAVIPQTETKPGQPGYSKAIVLNPAASVGVGSCAWTVAPTQGGLALLQAE